MALLQNTKQKFQTIAYETQRKLAESGDVSAMADVGLMLYSGYGAKLDVSESIRWYKKAAKLGDVRVNHFLAGYYFHEKKNKVLAFRHFKAAGRAGYVPSYPILSHFLANGIGCEKDEKKALYWCQKGADAGDMDSLAYLAHYYNEGLCGIEKNIEKAIDLIRSAAKQGHIKAQMVLGCAYLNGDGVRKNPRAAFWWLKKSAEQEDITAQYFLGACYCRGKGVRKNTELGAFWLKESANGGCSQAALALAEIIFPALATAS